jgi:hypothetical protein
MVGTASHSDHRQSCGVGLRAVVLDGLARKSIQLGLALYVRIA